MEERRDYAVLRFVDQNGWSYMVNDYAKGCSLMEYIKQGIRVEKETIFDHFPFQKTNFFLHIFQ